jgi:nicotinic acid phosphoribosyltransferase
MSSLYGLPLPLLTDSYKTSHYLLYPESKQMTCYGEFRTSFNKDEKDHRIVYYGIRYIIDHYVSKKYTLEDIELADQFFSTHCYGSRFPFPKDLFLKFVNENQGYFPVVIRSLAEGSVVYPHTPVYEITTANEYAHLVTYLETILTMVWYPSTVSTLSRKVKSVIEQGYQRTVEDGNFGSIETRLHDFGFRGCTSVEQAVIGGSAHLLHFCGSDTLPACWYVQKLNNNKPVGFSIPATEHSIMTSHRTEREAMLRAVEEFGEGVFACVMDSYDYVKALEELLPSIAKRKIEKGGVLILRPDSGDPVTVVLQALHAAEKVFGATVNLKGYKVLHGVGVIQGDGVDLVKIEQICAKVIENRFSMENVAFGMGGGLLQKVNRDTMSFATKVSQIVIDDSITRDVMKAPKTEKAKWSLPGRFCVVRDKGIQVYPLESVKSGVVDELNVVYDHGKVIKWDDFDTIRQRVQKQWNESPKTMNVFSKELDEKRERIAAEVLARNQ